MTLPRDRAAGADGQQQPLLPLDRGAGRGQAGRAGRHLPLGLGRVRPGHPGAERSGLRVQGRRHRATSAPARSTPRPSGCSPRPATSPPTCTRCRCTSSRAWSDGCPTPTTTSGPRRTTARSSPPSGASCSPCGPEGLRQRLHHAAPGPRARGGRAARPARPPVPGRARRRWRRYLGERLPPRRPGPIDEIVHVDGWQG